MVTFCNQCGTSLPLADVIITEGREDAPPDYICPSCSKPAGANADDNDVELPGEEEEMILAAGQATLRPASNDEPAAEDAEDADLSPAEDTPKEDDDTPDVAEAEASAEEEGLDLPEEEPETEGAPQTFKEDEASADVEDEERIDGDLEDADTDGELELEDLEDLDL